MPLPAGVLPLALGRAACVIACLMIPAAAGPGVARAAPQQTDVTDAELTAASGGRTVRVGPVSGNGPVVTLPIEVYVARVLAGEAEPRAAAAAQQALAVAIRTFAIANEGRHARSGFDLCDSTHCQVPRAATSATRRAALATAGQMLTRAGKPAEVFYSASCGGYSESAAEVWPGADYSYMPAAPDEVHEGDTPWTLVLPLREIERALAAAGFQGRLTAVRVESRNASGRAARLRVVGLRPDVVTGDRFRQSIGPARLRSTAFAIDAVGHGLRFTGRGYGHGVGMCVIGAGRRAARGESAEGILAQYFPGLDLTRLVTEPRVAVATHAAGTMRSSSREPHVRRAGALVEVGAVRQADGLAAYSPEDQGAPASPSITTTVASSTVEISRSPESQSRSNRQAAPASKRAGLTIVP